MHNNQAKPIHEAPVMHSFQHRIEKANHVFMPNKFGTDVCVSWHGSNGSPCHLPKSAHKP